MCLTHLKYLPFFFALLIGGSGAYAQSAVSVKATVDSTQLWIGSQTALTFEVVQPRTARVQLPLFSDTIVGNLQIVEQPQTDTLPLSDEKIRLRQRYTVTSFEDSLIYIRPFPFVAGDDTVWSNSLSIRVIQPFQIDTASQALADIKPVYTAPFNWGRFWARVALLWLLLALGVLLFVLIRRFVLNKPVVVLPEKPKPVEPPHREAIRRLDVLRDEKWWQKGRVKEYHTELTDIIRIYIEKMFNIGSMEMTSDEILEHVELLKVDKSGAYAALRQILSLADLVKFAKWNPAPADNELSLLNAYLFVNQTKIEEVTPLPAK